MRTKKQIGIWLAPIMSPAVGPLLAVTVAGTMLPMTASAEPVMIRVEARRGAEAQTAAQGWAAQFPDVVTFPLSGGWTGIALGPMERDEADKLIADLKSAGRVPSDSFIAVPDADADLTPVTGAAQAEAGAGAPVTGAGDAPAGTDGQTPPAEPAASDAETSAADKAQTGAAANQDDSAAQAADTATAAETGSGPAASMDTTQDTPPASDAAPAQPDEPAAAPSSDAAPDAAPEETAAAAAEPVPTHFIRLQSVRSRAEGDAALAEWRKAFPEAALSELPDDWFAVSLGPLNEDVAEAWLAAFRNAERAPKDAFVTTADKLGNVVDAGRAPNLPGPGSAQMPPLEDVQRALRWAGAYDGPVDGKDGPKTRAAIAAQIVTERAAPDAGTAMRRLMERREAWRVQVGLSELRDDHTGLAAIAPMDRLEFDRTQRALSIYRPKNESGAALILFSQPGGQQEMLDLAGLVTALGWVPRPERNVSQGRITLDGRNATHIGHAEGRVVDGRAEGFVLIWPVEDAENQPRIAAEISDSLHRAAPAANDATDADMGNANEVVGGGPADPLAGGAPAN